MLKSTPMTPIAAIKRTKSAALNPRSIESLFRDVSRVVRIMSSVATARGVPCITENATPMSDGTGPSA